MTIIALLTQGTAEVTGEKMPPGLVPLTAAAAYVAQKLNERIGPVEDDSEEAD